MFKHRKQGRNRYTGKRVLFLSAAQRVLMVFLKYVTPINYVFPLLRAP